MTDKMIELREIVVYDCCCLWDLFMDNVRGSGWTMNRIEDEAEKCADANELRKLVNRFV